jgi:glycosyltransferase involved in cell wall biosynthesis
MRILVVSSYPPRHCGIGAYARDQVARLWEEGHEVTVLSPPDGDGDLRARFVGGGAFRRAASIGGSFDRILVHFQPALYYRPRAALSKVMTSLSLWWLTVRRPSVEILIHEADPPVRWRPDYVLLRAALTRAAGLQFHTRAEWSVFEAAYGRIARGSLVPHAVHPAGSIPVREEARRAVGLEADGPVFVIPGFLQPSKGIDRVLGAFAGDDASSLYVVGSVRDQTPGNLAYVEELRARSGELPRVHLIERFMDDVEFDRWVAAADWVVVPYRRAWSSGVLARAHALGIPAIVTDVGGLSEQAGERDVVVPDQDDELIRALQRASAGSAAESRGTA